VARAVRGSLAQPVQASLMATRTCPDCGAEVTHFRVRKLSDDTVAQLEPCGHCFGIGAIITEATAEASDV
jgi:hypothetical protein